MVASAASETAEVADSAHMAESTESDKYIFASEFELEAMMVGTYETTLSVRPTIV